MGGQIQVGSGQWEVGRLFLPATFQKGFPTGGPALPHSPLPTPHSPLQGRPRRFPLWRPGPGGSAIPTPHCPLPTAHCPVPTRQNKTAIINLSQIYEFTQNSPWPSSNTTLQITEVTIMDGDISLWRIAMPIPQFSHDSDFTVVRTRKLVIRHAAISR